MHHQTLEMLFFGWTFIEMNERRTLSTLQKQQKCENFILGVDSGVMRVERKRGDTLKRKKGLALEWSERRDWKKATDSRRHQCRGQPSPTGGPSSAAKETTAETQETGHSPSFFSHPWLRPRSWLRPMKTSRRWLTAIHTRWESGLCY